ncbi:hypothetical protein FBQ97_00120 [Acidobacteria bacterium ACD]|nr:MAG: hypothetical protein EDX89_05580 [Acidobacteriota bacterium]MCE7956359.1 hypothetical protein [Acidobacteria bacterium ACB2]MDL1948210.1 hypothetical protein [Acidobacteria bacterium ACD]
MTTNVPHPLQPTGPFAYGNARKGCGPDLYGGPHTLLPLRFPSLEHMEARIRGAIVRIETVENLSPRTAAWLRESYSAFRRFLAEDDRRQRQFLGGDPRQQLRALEDWVASMNGSRLARSTVNNYWRGVRMVLSRVARDGAMQNPLGYLRAPHPGSTEPRFLTQEAAETVLLFVRNDASVPPPLRARNTAVFAVMLLAGLRRAEVLQLHVADVDFGPDIIRVRHGKGRHGGKPRTIPMTPQLARCCAAHLSFRRRAQTSSPHFFLGTRGRGGLAESTLVRLFRRVSRRAGIHVTPHMLRHTFCTLLSRAGVSDRLAKEAMGHADFSTLARYQHVYEGEVAAELTAKLRLNLGEPTT